MSTGNVSLQDSSESICRHCGTSLPEGGTHGSFCCAGCATVYAFLQECDLEKFYQLRSEEEKKLARPPKEGSTAFSYFDDPTFHDAFVRVISADLSEVSFFIEGVHCTACIWLLEKLPILNSAVHSARLNYSTSKLTVQFKTSAKLSEVAQAISSIGYTPRALEENAFEEEYRKESLQLLYRLGVAGVSAGNCMMIAVSLYEGSFSGIESRFKLFFIGLSAVICLPVLLYSAQPFYRAAIQGLRAKRAHVDLPISIGIIGGYLLSCLSAFRGSDAIYFDSIAILVFLMLAARSIQRYSLKKISDLRSQLRGFLPQTVTKLSDGKTIELYREALQPGDHILIAPNERVACDASLVSQGASIDKSVLTGESRPIDAHRGELIYAGSKNLGGEIELVVERAPKDSRIHSYFSASKQSAFSSVTTGPSKSIELIAQWFVTTVLFVASVTFLYWTLTTDLFTAAEVTLSFLIVTCPCALGLATPLLLSKAVVDGIQSGVFVSEPNSFELTARAKHFFIDKTGTLTSAEGRTFSTRRWKDGSWRDCRDISEDERSIILALEERNFHPIADTFRRSFTNTPGKREFSTIKTERLGISGTLFDGTEVVIGHHSFILDHSPTSQEALSEYSSDYGTVFFCHKETLLAFNFKESLKDGAIQLVQLLGEKLSILSGDDEAAVKSIGGELGLPENHLSGDLSPEDKSNEVASTPGITVMIGDGANDAPAFHAATVGIGLRGGAEQLLSVADVYIKSGELTDLLSFLSASKRTVFVLRSSYAFSLFYNVAIGTIAVCGGITPLLAAILMPISSFTVIGIAAGSRPFTRRETTSFE